MGVREGYRQTEVGIIPKDWEIATFCELFDFQNGVNADKRAYGSGVRFINVLEVITHAHLHQEHIPGRVTLPKSAIPHFAVRYGDLLFNRTSETQEEIALSAVYIGSEAVVFGGFVIRGKPRAGALDPIFSGYAFRARPIRAQIVKMGQGAVRANVGQKDLGKVLAALPKPPEQRLIAAVLNDADTLVLTLEALLKKKRNLKQATMQQLLTKKTRLPGFKGDWKLKRLGELLEYEQPTKYLVKTKEYEDKNDVPVLTAGKTFVLGYTNETHNIFDSLPVIIFDDFTTATKYVTFPFKAKSSAMKLLKPRHADVNLRLVYELMQLVKHPLSDHKRYWISEYQHLTIAIPDPDEQMVIAAVLSDMDDEIIALEIERDKAVDLKQGMMQELLTGRIRLK